MGGIKLLRTARDERIIHALQTLRIADRQQLSLVAPFTSVPRANARLLALTRAGIIRRRFTGTIHGGRRAVYFLSHARASWSESFVEHELHVGSLHLLFSRGPLPPGITFRRWTRPSAGRSPAVGVIPDGYVELNVPEGVWRAFVEIDQGTESLRVWRGKAHEYLSLANSMNAVENRFRILVVTSSDRRARSIQRTIHSIVPNLFYISTFDAINRDGLFARIWLRPTGEERQPLMRGVQCVSVATAFDSHPDGRGTVRPAGNPTTRSSVPQGTETAGVRESAPSADHVISVHRNRAFKAGLRFFKEF